MIHTPSSHAASHWFILTGLLASSLGTSGCTLESEASGEHVDSAQQELTMGLDLVDFQLDNTYTAVGALPGCSATLISHEAVLTAAHCVCPYDDSTQDCGTRTRFTLKNVRPASNPTQAPRDISIDGSVTVFPNYGQGYKWAKDYAIVKLDVPVYDRAVDVVPMPVGHDGLKPKADDIRTLAGYGYGGFHCDQPVKGRVHYAHIYEVVPDAIRVDRVGAIACKGDSGGPMFDFDQFVLGVASWNSAGNATYRPIYEERTWVHNVIDPLESASDVARFQVSKGTSWDLGKDADVYQNYRPQVGIVGQGISPSDGLVYTWYINGVYSVGRSWDLAQNVERQRFSLPYGYLPQDVVGMAFASNNRVYAWYQDGKVSVGKVGDLDSYSSPYSYSVAPGHTPSDIVGIDISSSDLVYTWYRDGVRSVGRSWDLDASSVSSYVTASGRTPEDIAEVAIAEVAPGIDRAFTWYKVD